MSEYNIKSIFCTIATDTEIEKYSRYKIIDINQYISPLSGASEVGSDDCIYCNNKCFGHSIYVESKELLCNPLFANILDKIISTICTTCKIISNNKSCTNCGRDIKPKHIGKNITSVEAKELITYCYPLLSNLITNKIMLIPRMMLPSVIDCEKPIKQFYSKYFLEACLSNKSCNTEYYNMIISNKLSLINSLKGKDGIMRRLMVGKRVDHGGRAVIVGSDLIDVNTILLPNKIYNCFKPKVVVTHDNIENLISLANKNSLYTSSGEIVHVASIKHGRIYRRDLNIEDLVIINRQPSLGKGSVMGFHPMCHNKNVMTINTSITGSFAADFDGDEMNIFYQENINKNISINNNTQNISLIQDTITIYYKLSSNVEQISKDVYMNASYVCHSDNYRDLDIVTTLDLLSLPFPKWLNISNEIEIVNGILVSGIITNKVIKDIVKIIRITDNDIILFIRSIQSLVSYITSTIYPVSISLDDFIVDLTLRDSYFDDIINPTSEELVILSDNASTLCTINVLKNIPKSNLYNMVFSGSKGNIDNLVDMTYSIRYQKIRNEILEKSCCKSSFLEGLNPQEYFRHMINSREGIVAVNIKTSDIGYIGRKLCKTMSNTILSDNYSVQEFGIDVCSYIDPILDINETILSNFIF